MPIDTGSLSDKTYNAVMIEAEHFNHDLTLQFGLLSYECADEADFILQSEKMIDELFQLDEDDLYDIFGGNPPDKRLFHLALKRIKKNISELK